MTTSPWSSELDRIACQVDDDLPQPTSIADQIVGQTGGDATGKLQPFLGGPDRQHLPRLPTQFLRLKSDRFQLQLARLDLGEVKDVVE